MELWLSIESPATSVQSADAVVLLTLSGPPNWVADAGPAIQIYQYGEGQLWDDSGNTIGKFLQIDNNQQQTDALAQIGLADWLVIDCGDWKMIPFENLVAATEGSGTRIAAVIENIDQLQGAAFALQTGVDALLLPDDNELWVAAQQLVAERKILQAGQVPVTDLGDELTLEPLEIVSVTPAGIGERVCVDLVELLKIGEGLLVGSSSKALCLVHGETVDSQFVPARPFRVNAGPVHSYVLMADGSTKYLSELRAGDEVLVKSANGSRPVTIGRLKIEKRPLLLATFRNKSGESGQIILQQAETVRLVGVSRETPSITHIEAGMQVLGVIGESGRHVGRPIGSTVEER